MLGGCWRIRLGVVGVVSSRELEDVCVYGEDGEEDTGEGGDEDGEDMREMGRGGDEMGPNAEDKKGK